MGGGEQNTGGEHTGRRFFILFLFELRRTGDGRTVGHVLRRSLRISVIP